MGEVPICTGQGGYNYPRVFPSLQTCHGRVLVYIVSIKGFSLPTHNQTSSCFITLVAAYGSSTTLLKETILVYFTDIYLSKWGEFSTVSVCLWSHHARFTTADLQVTLTCLLLWESTYTPVFGEYSLWLSTLDYTILWTIWSKLQHNREVSYFINTGPPYLGHGDPVSTEDAVCFIKGYSYWSFTSCTAGTCKFWKFDVTSVEYYLQWQIVLTSATCRIPKPDRWVCYT